MRVARGPPPLLVGRDAVLPRSRSRGALEPGRRSTTRKRFRVTPLGRRRSSPLDLARKPRVRWRERRWWQTRAVRRAASSQPRPSLGCRRRSGWGSCRRCRCCRPPTTARPAGTRAILRPNRGGLSTTMAGSRIPRPGAIHLGAGWPIAAILGGMWAAVVVWRSASYELRHGNAGFHLVPRGGCYVGRRVTRCCRSQRNAQVV